MLNRNSLEVQEYAQASSLNNTNLTASQGELILTVANLLFKESNINNHQNIQRDNNISYENNITDFENQDTSCGICKCLGAIATVCCNVYIFLFE
ncbi:hypothetical protein [Rickettsia rickettsii]|uniref:Uncharacterized protein n=2 Tax=Rickettsia rickettsii TaxID=783 RepID=B0BYD0_RICRO|nr:hypothetical protein [Rickettsia rickettsii]ABV76479.1 hypothetical protein A1G_04895 [Rickettsia rickettsii str. 'Sheila Smith']ABY72856.1 hypothetical protein RrIowa_1055 [Rickettsia rickettsii str. Iowa]AFB21954.1 hypothetical protein RPN_02100 [Rickettsia rickettsii str. Brazil]AFB23827.1 hypothetical protein RPL_04950 [Rickettsia rickettsii str. Colombia]AFB25172.1 hypothetical protein RPO_04955 [Rickettsia rickettsii str. Arizona]